MKMSAVEVPDLFSFLKAFLDQFADFFSDTLVDLVNEKFVF